MRDLQLKLCDIHLCKATFPHRVSSDSHHLTQFSYLDHSKYLTSMWELVRNLLNYLDRLKLLRIQRNLWNVDTRGIGKSQTNKIHLATCILYLEIIEPKGCISRKSSAFFIFIVHCYRSSKQFISNLADVLHVYLTGSAIISSSATQAVSNSPGTPPANRSIMSSPFSVLQRPEHGFAHIHPQGHQVSSFNQSNEHIQIMISQWNKGLQTPGKLNQPIK